MNAVKHLRELRRLTYEWPELKLTPVDQLIFWNRLYEHTGHNDHYSYKERRLRRIHKTLTIHYPE